MEKGSQHSVAVAGRAVHRCVEPGWKLVVSQIQTEHAEGEDYSVTKDIVDWSDDGRHENQR